MPYKKYYKKKYPKKSKGYVAKVAKQVVKQQLKKAEEIKYHVTNNNLFINQVAAGVLHDLSITSQGASDIQRIGDKIRLKSLNINYDIRAVASETYVRVMVIQWREDSTTSTPTLSSVLQTPAYSGGQIEPILSTLQHDGVKMGKFTVLYDRVHNLKFNAQFGQPEKQIVNKKISLKYAAKHLQYLNGTSAGTNKLYMLMTSSDPLNNADMRLHTKLTYTDC